MPSKLSVNWLAYPEQDYLQLSSVLNGLGELRYRGAIELHVTMTDDKIDSNVMEPAPALRLELKMANGAQFSRRVAIECYDGETRLATEALHWCDVYFKRQFGPKSSAAATNANAHKIRPLGLTIASYNLHSWNPIFHALLKSILVAGRSTRSGAFRDRLRQARLTLLDWLYRPSIKSVILRPNDRKANGIVFQPRLWDTRQSPNTIYDVANEDRIAAVRTLRNRFPQFARSIGLLTDSFALAVAQEETLHPPVRLRDYHRQLRGCSVAVNCVGLAGSVGWKFAEYLAAGNAIVTPPINHTFLSPLRAGVNYLEYQTLDDCIAKCEQLLANSTATAAMCAANRQYFLEWVDPRAHVEKLLALALAA